MLTNELITQKVTPVFPDSTNEFLYIFEEAIESEVYKGPALDFHIKYKKNTTKKIPPILRLAEPEDAREIVEIYKENYDGTYPYKDLLDVEEVSKKIRDPNVMWILFKSKEGETVGCFTFIADFKKKLGYIRGLMLKGKFQGKYDVLKAALGSFIWVFSTYQGKIFRWYTENRTAHSTSQFITSVGGVRPIGFYPNKDIFFNEIESDIMHICYDKRALTELRSNKVPKFLPVTLNCFSYSDQRYNLGPYEVRVPQFNLDPILLSKIYKNVQVKVDRDKFGYETVRFYLLGSESYFEFLYTPQLLNIEKCSYNVDNLEELFVFAQKTLKFMRILNIRYFEVFVSAYRPEHQKIFYDIGMVPRGYVPSWEYNEVTKKFEDSILFNYYEGEISKNIRLVEEGEDLLRYLNFY